MTDKSDKTPEFMTKAKFGKLVDSAVLGLNLTYMDAIIHVCEQNVIELEDIKKYVSPVLKAKVEVEAMNLNFLEKNAELPFE